MSKLLQSERVLREYGREKTGKGLTLGREKRAMDGLRRKLPEGGGAAGSCGSLADFTRTGLIVPELRERDTAGVIKELSEILHERGGVPDLLSFYHAALNHEFLVNTASECGVAFPHARLHGVTQSMFAFGRSPEPISWGSRSSQLVEFVFLLAVPATDAAGFLQLLSALARLGQNSALLAGLRAPNSPEEIFQLFKAIGVRHG